MVEDNEVIFPPDVFQVTVDQNAQYDALLLLPYVCLNVFLLVLAAALEELESNIYSLTPTSFKLSALYFCFIFATTEGLKFDSAYLTYSFVKTASLSLPIIYPSDFLVCSLKMSSHLQER